MTRYFPAALELFGGLQAQITLSFLLEYRTPQAVADLSYEEFTQFISGRRYPRRWWPQKYARLQRLQPQASSETIQVYQEEMVLLADQLLALVRSNRLHKRELTELFTNILTAEYSLPCLALVLC